MMIPNIRTRVRVTAGALAAAVALLAATMLPSAAFAHPPKPTPTPGPATDTGADRAEPARVEVRVVPTAALGDRVLIEATLTDADNRPIRDALITFSSPVSWGESSEAGMAGDEAGGDAMADHEAAGEQPGAADMDEHGVSGELVIGTAVTDERGRASIVTELRRAGEIEIHAAFDGDARYAPAEASASLTVEGSRQLYTPEVGVRVKGLGPWLLALVVASIWGLYLLAAGRVLAIARSPNAAIVSVAGSHAGDARSPSRRQFLTRALVPLGMHAVIASLGAGLVTLIARAPYTHANLESSVRKGAYRNVPVAYVGRRPKPLPVPPVLDREVSFQREVLPILRRYGGPHALPPENSPAPFGVRFDTYEHLMATEGLVVPGKPEESTLVRVLVDPAMGMPPSIWPLPSEAIQVIASWVAQGAKNN